MTGSNWQSMFGMAFRSSRNAMVLVDEQRRILDANGALVKLVRLQAQRDPRPTGLGVRRQRSAAVAGTVGRRACKP
jgi:PAS domain-containing protein